MAFDANARIALPEFVYINLDICYKKSEQFHALNTKTLIGGYLIIMNQIKYLVYSNILW